MKELTVLGIDLAKQVFHVVGMDNKGRVLLRKRLYRSDLESFVSNLSGSVLIGMEACSSSNYWGRVFRGYGHNVKLVAPQFVKPYVKSNKNDNVDAEAIAEAVSRPTMRFVPIKSMEQQDIQSLHRIRERLVKSRTALINETRGLLGENGITLPKSVLQFRKRFVESLEDNNSKLTSLSRETFFRLYQEYVELEERICFYNDKLQAIAKAHPVATRLQTIPGIGPLTATAILASVGDMSCFKSGREFSAWLGLVPRQHSTGGKTKLFGISKRGDVYLRKLLVHEARTTLRWVDNKSDRLSVWAKELKEKKGGNRTAVALANKNARIVWAMLSREENYKEFQLV